MKELIDKKSSQLIKDIEKVDSLQDMAKIISKISIWAFYNYDN